VIISHHAYGQPAGHAAAGKPDGCLGTRPAMVGTPGSLLHQA
jgi:hypothetical protein